MYDKLYEICNGADDKGCGGTISPVAKDGRFFLFRDVSINLPKDLYIPRCDKCETDWFDNEIQAALDIILNKEYHLHEDLIEEARSRFSDRV